MVDVASSHSRIDSSPYWCRNDLLRHSTKAQDDGGKEDDNSRFEEGNGRGNDTDCSDGRR